jgi:S-adenosylmethionine:tRNA ribosyltransferase-isomerase
LRYSTEDFHYDCPSELIAQRPLPDRAASRLLILDRRSGRIDHGAFSDFPTLLEPDDVLVVNASRVIRARLHGRRENGRDAQVLLVHPEPDGTWLAMVHPGGKLKTGRTIAFGDEAVLEVVDVIGGGVRRVRLSGSLDWSDLMERYGSVPLPPYIQRSADAADRDRYQTVYAQVDGSVAAPTAGLHFTHEILGAIRDRGVQVVEIVLHVGPGTFKPVAVSDPENHVMHAEWFQISHETARTIAEAHGRVWAVGTTVARVLETVGASGSISATEGWTQLFIHPPFRFRVVDAMITNFHLPCSTLLMLVCAFGGYEQIMKAYRAAVAARYRLYSYGDAMAVI